MLPAKPRRARTEAKGKWWETRIEDAFRPLCKRLPAFFHRFTDSHAAGSLVARAPADYLLKTPHGALLIEAKSSEVHDTFASGYRSLLKAHQNANMRLWDRAGGQGLYLFAHKETQEVEAWDARVVHRAFVKEVKKLTAADRVVGFHISNLERFAEKLILGEIPL